MSGRATSISLLRSIKKMAHRGMPFSEIADILNIDIELVKNYLSATPMEQEEWFRELTRHLLEDPKELVCPISLTLISDPVTAADSYTYERQCISTHLSNRKTSPMTNQKMRSALNPNQFMKSAVTKFKLDTIAQIVDVVPILMDEGLNDCECMLARAEDLCSTCTVPYQTEMALLELWLQTEGPHQAEQKQAVARKLIAKGVQVDATRHNQSWIEAIAIAHSTAAPSPPPFSARPRSNSNEHFIARGDLDHVPDGAGDEHDVDEEEDDDKINSLPQQHGYNRLHMRAQDRREYRAAACR